MMAPPLFRWAPPGTLSPGMTMGARSYDTERRVPVYTGTRRYLLNMIPVSYLPLNCGFLFSMKALADSFISSEPMRIMFICMANIMPSQIDLFRL